jgi:site-specific recombinase XerD
VARSMGEGIVSTTLGALIREYLDYIAGVRRLSPRSVEAYGRDLGLYLRFCEEHEVPLPPGRRDARAFLASLGRANLSSRSVNRVLAGVRGFFRYLRKRELLKEDPFAELEGLKLNRRLPAFLFPEEIDAMLALPGDDFGGTRDRLILELLYSTGCRVGEAAAILTKAIPPGGHRVKVLGKGDRERFVYLGAPARRALAEYLAQRTALLQRLGTEDGGTLFLNRRGKPLSARGFRGIITAYALRAGLNKSVSPHSFRHSFATHLMESGAGIRNVQELLGHSSLRATQVYTHVELDRLRQVHAAAHPHGGTKHEKTPAEAGREGQTEWKQ